ncbi:hypothetical protein ACSVIJ_04620 [Pseudomonas sp. NCHU5208]|uniref:hypothetical protein n=1 Tax=unclassified Pseudomonas TaxID=196821 RepID=UPI003F982FF6
MYRVAIALFGLALMQLWGLAAASTHSEQDSKEIIADNVGQCGNRPSFGCERGAWSLNNNREATIASLKEVATYRVCAWDAKSTNDIALNVLVDGEVATIGAPKRPLVLMPVLDTVAEPNNGASCVLLTGKKIVLRAADGSNPSRTPRGFYERLGPQPFTGQQRLEAQPPESGSILFPIAVAQSTGTEGHRLYRVCIGRFIGPADDTTKFVRSQIVVDQTTIQMTTSSCVDVEGTTVSGEAWGPGGSSREPAVSGLLVY